jgi:CspA family cold shock protein
MRSKVLCLNVSLLFEIQIGESRAKALGFFLQKDGITEMRLNGKVKWFSNKLGYGFIKQDTGEEIFVHYSMIRGDGYRSLKEGQEVTFDIIQSPEGRMQAGDVEIVLAS